MRPAQRKIGTAQRLDEYQRRLLPAGLRRTTRLNGSAAARYLPLYKEADMVGERLREWRKKRTFDRQGASAQLPGWTSATIALFEQGLLLLSELDDEMLSSLERVIDL